MAAVIALALSGLLILAMTGAFIGISKAVSAFIDRSSADIIILSANARTMDDSGGGVPARLQPSIYMHPEVLQATRMSGVRARWINDPLPGKEAKSPFVQIWGIDTHPGAPTMPSDFPPEVRRALNEPFTVVIDQSAQGALGATLGDTVSLNGRAVRIAAMLTNYPNVINTEIFASRHTVRMLGLEPVGYVNGPMMATLRDPSRAEQVRDELNAAAEGKYRAWTRPELARANQSIVFEEQVVGILLGFMVILGFLIGIGVTCMTLRGAIMANIKELASFRALGVSVGSLRLVVLELSFWVGVVGIALSGLMVWGISVLAINAGMVLAYPLIAVVGTVTMLLVIAMLSGALSLGVLKRAQPADLLR